MSSATSNDSPQDPCVNVNTGPHGLVVEAWGQGYMVGSLVILMALTVATMRRRILLHKLILAEVRGNHTCQSLPLRTDCVNSFSSRPSTEPSSS